MRNPIHLLSLLSVLASAFVPHGGVPMHVTVPDMISAPVEEQHTLRQRRRKGDVDVDMPCEEIFAIQA